MPGEQESIASMDAALERDMVGDGSPPAPENEPAPEPKRTDDRLPDFVPDPDEPPEAGTGAAPKPKTVPHEALHAERAEVKRLREEGQARQAEFNRMQQEMARGEERLAILLGMLQPGQQQPTPPPNPEEDPMAAISWIQQEVLRQRRVEEENARQRQTQDQEAQRRQAADNQVRQLYQEGVAEWRGYVAENPAANEAYNHLINARATQLRLFGVPESEIQSTIHKEELQLVVAARKQGRSLGELITGYARAYGWNPPAPGGVQNQNQGQQPQRDDKGRFVPSGEIDRIKKAASAAESLSTTGGGSPRDNSISFESLGRMSDDEFSGLVKNIYKRGGEESMDAALERMMGINGKK